MKNIDAAQLGGTLFVPAVHKHLEAVARAEKFPQLRSVVFDTEDGLAEEALEEALGRIEALLPTLQPESLLRFIRPRNVETLRQILQFSHIEKIDGFVLPKFGLENADLYLSCLMDQGVQHLFMPSIEGRELFDTDALKALRELLLPHRKRIIAVRFGAEDMLRQLGMRRDCSVSLYDLCAPSAVIGNLLGAFKPYGFDISAPVYRCYNDAEGFEKEVLRDLQEGLIGKTIIHPGQIEPIERLYRVGKAELETARRILSCEEAVFAMNGAMAESATQQPWAQGVLKRAEVYGIA